MAKRKRRLLHAGRRREANNRLARKRAKESRPWSPLLPDVKARGPEPLCERCRRPVKEGVPVCHRCLDNQRLREENA